MSFENPQNIITSWNLQSNFATGPVVVDKLVPPRYARIRTNFIQTWREEALTSQLDWGKTVNIYLPESLRVVSSIFLRIPLPVLGSASYKAYPGLYAIKEIRLLSAGQEVYPCRYADFLVDYCQSLDARRTSPTPTSGAAPLRSTRACSCSRSCSPTRPT